MTTIVFDPQTKLFKIHCRSRITHCQREMVHNLGWVIYVDGHHQLHAMIDAPEEAYEKLSSIFTMPNDIEQSEDDHLCWGCGKKIPDTDWIKHSCYY